MMIQNKNDSYIVVSAPKNVIIAQKIEPFLLLFPMIANRYGGPTPITERIETTNHTNDTNKNQ